MSGTSRPSRAEVPTNFDGQLAPLDASHFASKSTPGVPVRRLPFATPTSTVVVKTFSGSVPSSLPILESLGHDPKSDDYADLMRDLDDLLIPLEASSLDGDPAATPAPTPTPTPTKTEISETASLGLWRIRNNVPRDSFFYWNPRPSALRSLHLLPPSGRPSVLGLFPSSRPSWASPLL